MAKREFLMLAHTLKPKHGIAGNFLSEKKDGIRGLSDGGVTRGIPKTEVPWANNDKDERYLTPPISTGLWTRYGNVIHAPDWWLDLLPKIMLDFEFFTKRQDRQGCSSIIKDLIPGPGWKRVKCLAFDSPPPEVVFADGHVGKNNDNFDKVFEGCVEWFMARQELDWYAKPTSIFESVLKRMQMEIDPDNSHIKVLTQIKLPYGPLARETADGCLDEFVKVGGEGIIIRDPHSNWVPERSHKMLKLKEYRDSEATVMGYTTGRLTAKGSKLLGKMGALIVNFDGKRLELSGFTEDERSLGWTPGECRAEETCSPTEWAIDNPGEEVPDWIQAEQFPRDTVITFKYRDLTRDGIPQEASYFRKRG